GHVSSLIQAEHSIGQRITAAEVIEQPPVEARHPSQGLLNLGDALLVGRSVGHSAAILSLPLKAVNPMCQAVPVACYNAPSYAPKRAQAQNKHVVGSDSRVAAVSRDALLRPRAGE